MKFSQKVVIVSSILLFVTVALLSLQQLRTVRTEMNALLESSMEQMVLGVKNTVVSEMDGKKVLAQTVADTLELHPSDRDYVKSVLETPTLKSLFMAIGYGYQSDGSFIHNVDDWFPGDEFITRERPWFKDAKAQNKLTVTAPYVDATTGEIVISIAVPIHEHGQFIGAMYYDMSMGSMSELVNQTSLFSSDYLFIVTADGTTVAHPDATNNGKPMSSYFPAEIKEGTQEIELNGEELLVHFTPIPSENWYIAEVVNKDEAFAAETKLRNHSIIMTLVGLVISVIILTLLIRILMKPLGELNKAIQDIASGEGDLTQRLSTNTDKEFAELALGFNTFTENLQIQIQQSKMLSGSIRRGTELSAIGARESAQAMHSQLHELEQLATAMNEMSVTATEVANNAQGAAEAAKSADEAAQEGSQVVHHTTSSINTLSERIDQAVEEVQGLEAATSNIETILKVINDIADQTNLLALNAAIEAARAGESGRGFAVVADEVRTLAQRTQQSTTEIRSIIEQLQAGANAVSVAMNESKTTAIDAVNDAQAANQVLDKIREAIHRISDMNMQIASAAEEQSQVTEEINNNTMKIKDISTAVADSAHAADVEMKERIENVLEQDNILNRFTV